MAILYKTSLEGVEVYPEHQGNSNVIRVVTWNINFYNEEFPDVVTVGQAETLLPEPTPGAGFSDIAQLTKGGILQWAFEAAGGEQFIEQLRPAHEEHLAYLLQKAGTVEYDITTIG